MIKKKKVAIVRGKFLNQYEMQSFEPLASKFDITAFGSLSSFHDTFAFPTVKLPSPMDLLDFPYKMPILNRAFIDAQYLLGLENHLEGFDIVHTAETYYHYTQQSLNARKRGNVKKVIATVLENIPFNNEGIWGRKKFKKSARDGLDHIIALTNRTKEALLLEGAKDDKITVVSHGINTSRFIPSARKSTNRLTILFVGRLEVYKGIYEVIYAFKRLLEDKDLRAYSLTLLVVGNGSEKKELLQREKELKISRYVTHLDVTYADIPDVYKKADIFVAPSKESQYWIEQYNTSLLEAQAAGLSIVTTYSGGIPENVGNTAVLVSPGDVLSLKKELKEFILYPQKRKTYGSNARKRALEVHDVKIISKQISKVYEQVLTE